jgi:hypothetical protein
VDSIFDLSLLFKYCSNADHAICAVTVNVHERETVQCGHEQTECSVIISVNHQQVPNATQCFGGGHPAHCGHPKCKGYHRPSLCFLVVGQAMLDIGQE